MPIIHFINNKSQTTGGMRNVINYIGKKEKTQHEDKRFVTGLNCSPETAYDEMTATKNLYHKNDGRFYYHLVQSFPSGYNIEPELAHKIAVELAEKEFGNYEVVVATHIDREHIHSHFVFNSVSFEYGKKYHSDRQSVENLMKLSNEICQKYGIDILDDPSDKLKKKNDFVSDREYRSAKKGDSFKWELMNVINQVMKQAKTKKQFCYLMRKYGYGVRWEDNRKYITYTGPNGRKCRCNKLHGERYGKEMLEREFEIRRVESALQQGVGTGGGHTSGGDSSRFKLESVDRIEQTNVTGAVGNSQQAVGTYDSGRSQDFPQNGSLRAEGNDRELSGNTTDDGGANRNNDSGAEKISGESDLTGWEAERAVFLEAERVRRIQAQTQLENGQVGSDFTVDIDSVFGSVTTVASIIENEPIDDNTEYAREHVDRKALAKEMRKKEALGMHMG